MSGLPLAPFAYLKDSFDVLYAEGETAPKMMSVGLLCRLLGRPGRAAALARFLDYVASREPVWASACRRAQHHHRTRAEPPERRCRSAATDEQTGAAAETIAAAPLLTPAIRCVA
jgi:hypothetical protein